MARPAKPTKPEAEPEEDPALESDESESHWDDELRAWEEEGAFEDSELRITVFRQSSKAGPVEKVWEYIDEPVTTHEIGLRFGGGRYRTYARLVRDGKILQTVRRRFILAESYTQEVKSRMPTTAAHGPAMGGASILEYMEGFGRMLAAAAPMVAAVKEVFAGRNAIHMTGMEEANKVVGKVIAESAQSMISLHREIKKELGTMGNPQPQPQPTADEETVNEYKAYLLEVAKEYGPKLLEAVGLKLNTALGFIRADSTFRTLRKNQNLFEQVYAKLTNDPEMSDADRTLVHGVLEKLASNGLGFQMPTNGAGDAGHRSAHATASINGQR